MGQCMKLPKIVVCHRQHHEVHLMVTGGTYLIRLTDSPKHMWLARANRIPFLRMVTLGELEQCQGLHEIINQVFVEYVDLAIDVTKSCVIYVKICQKCM